MILERYVMHVRSLLPVEQKAGVVIGERIWLIEAGVLLGDQLPKVQIFLGTIHLNGFPASGVGKGEQIKQFVAEKP